MDFTVKLYSHDFCPSGETNPFHLIVDDSIWSKVYNDTEGGGRIFLRVFNEDGTKEWIAPMGGVVRSDHHQNEDRRVYMPFWMLDTAGFEGSGEVLKCSILTNEAFPEATKITLRVVDSAFYNSDVKEELEAALTHLGILRRHTTIQIPVQRLGDFPIELFVSELEPADCVLCDGDEVAVEFEEPVDHYEPPVRPPTPIPQLPTQLEDLMLPPPEPSSNGFVAFQGQGNLVGTSNVNIPEWRRQLGPPRRPEPRRNEVKQP
jgi:hypothetical protein